MNKLIFLVLDEIGVAWAVAPSKVQARKWIAWYLPKCGSYRIEPYIVPA